MATIFDWQFPDAKNYTRDVWTNAFRIFGPGSATKKDGLNIWCSESGTENTQENFHESINFPKMTCGENGD